MHMVMMLLLWVMCQSSETPEDALVLATSERLFLNGNPEAAAEMISSHSWSPDSIWSRAGLILELCRGGFSHPMPPMVDSGAGGFSAMVETRVRGSFAPGDSIRLLVPVPAELPWQQTAVAQSADVRGLSGASSSRPGWLVVEGVAAGEVEVAISHEVSVSSTPFHGTEAPGIEEAMVYFPGEDPFMDSCLDTFVFWAGGYMVYMESVQLARAEPNPMRLAAVLRNYLNGFFQGSAPVEETILLTPAATLALGEGLKNSAGGAFLGAAILRNWQIPALPVPGRFAEGQGTGYALFMNVKPFGWMAISPLPAGFTAMGTAEPPEVSSWHSGVPGLTVYAESKGEDGFWTAVPAGSTDMHYSVDVSLL